MYCTATGIRLGDSHCFFSLFLLFKTMLFVMRCPCMMRLHNPFLSWLLPYVRTYKHTRTHECECTALMLFMWNNTSLFLRLIFIQNERILTVNFLNWKSGFVELKKVKYLLSHCSSLFFPQHFKQIYICTHHSFN